MLRDLWTLFAVFFRIGLYSIGGGYVMLPMLRREIVEQRGWASDEDMLNYYAIGQATPGIIAINTATFVGYRRRGVLGALAATLGMVGPSLLIITTIAVFFQRFSEYALVQKAFQGIRVGVTVLILFTLVSMGRKAIHNPFGAFLCLGAFLAVVLGALSPIPVILAAAVLGLVLRPRAKAGETP